MLVVLALCMSSLLIAQWCYLTIAVLHPKLDGTGRTLPGNGNFRPKLFVTLDTTNESMFRNKEQNRIRNSNSHTAIPITVPGGSDVAFRIGLRDQAAIINLKPHL